MKSILPIILSLSTIVSIHAQAFKDKQNLVKHEGLFNFYYSEEEDRIFLKVDQLNEDFLYVHFLTTGLGSNDIGLDRGQLGGTAVVRFEKAGNKLLLIQPNQDFRAETQNQLERQSVEQAFVRSVLYGFKIEEEQDGSYIIDLTPFLLQDAHGVAHRLKQGDFGTYSIAKEKSALSMERTKAFPENVEFEALLTFEGEPKGRDIRSVAPNASNLSLIQHHSFVKLPDDGYQKRNFDPRSGAIYISYMDYSTPVFEPITKRYVVRHRLEKKDSEAAFSEAVAPIVYYLDPGTPEPVKSALLEGAAWWNQAFEAIGYKDAFQVKMLPEDADPLDVRYNVIQWVHRSTRGWSYGASVVDPRTGEIIKGHVSLGSLRIRQDLLIAQALMNRPFATDDLNHGPMLDMALARIRQLSAHEVGHTLGFAHNFAGSSDENSSVMDYPHPQFELENGKIEVSKAYETGIGEWDKFTVKYSYAHIPEAESEDKFLNSVLAEANDRQLQFISDADARAPGGAHVNAHLWDNGKNAAEALEEILKIRELGIANFSEDNIRSGEAFSVLEDAFVPLYFLHRYQTEAAVKAIGGLNYNYAVKGGGQKTVVTLEREQQEEALHAVLKTLEPKVLAVPEDKLHLFPPRAYGFGRSRESFASNAGVAFDALGAPATASQLTLSLLLHPERAARLIQQKAVDKNQIGLEEVLHELLERTIRSSKTDSFLQEVQNAINYNVLDHLMNLAVHEKATPQVKAVTFAELEALEDWLQKKRNRTNSARAHLLRKIQTFKKVPSNFKLEHSTPNIPDGSPIGSF
ncbi:zinc-dependent metalloprotease [Salinimicrobium oceani]|uniref:DUF5117 domain-containing protein n=1 Tax=Salinimicrobium oceani TaxID=2722702 RepID=A0ABX1CYS6_9FLAO|nr:zinc-dependent metalloprotease [Salinimicrobium oceani]NJW52544.1 DUF5117 domain-containing protein [Salinimicrobium oceani]